MRRLLTSLALLTAFITAFAHAADLEATGAADENPTPFAVLKGSSGTAASFSAEGNRILTAGGSEARVWDANSFKPLTEPLKHKEKIRAAVVSRDEAIVVTAAGKSAYMWDAATGQLQLTLEHPDRVLDVSISPDGKRIATGCVDRWARVWEATSGKPLAELKHEGPVRTVCFSPARGVLLLTGHVLVDVPPDQRDQIDVNDPHALGDAQVWDLTDNRRVWHIRKRKEMDFCQGRPVFSSDGRRVGVPGKRAYVCDAGTGEWLSKPLSRGAINFFVIDFSRDGNRMVAAGDEGNEDPEGAVKVAEIAQGPRDWDDRDESPYHLETLASLAPAQSVSAAISPDGKTIAIISEYEPGRSLTGLWDVKSGRQVLGTAGPEHWLQGPAPERVVAFSPDGKHIAIGCNAIRGESPAHTEIWRVPPVKEETPATPDTPP